MATIQLSAATITAMMPTVISRTFEATSTMIAMPGMVIITSEAVRITASVTPPTKPEISPSATPTQRLMRPARRPMVSVCGSASTRAATMSRPWPSVPSQNSPEGARRGATAPTSARPASTTKGPTSAASRMAPRMPMPQASGGFCRSARIMPSSAG